jgi:predicted metal-dependent HD superfamily phosphohydrolase
MDLSERWQGAWRALRRVASASLLARLMHAYSEPHRRYHTLQHLEDCLQKLDEARSLAGRPAEVELALWFHDAIYDVRRDDNEARSAQWAREAIGGEAGERVHDLVLATRHSASPSAADAALVVDIDLSILGAPAHAFDDYERQIREEYAWVPAGLFRRRRRAILDGILARPFIFSTLHFRERLEVAARENLARSIAALQ